MAFDKDELRKAALAHMTSRRVEGPEARRLAEAVEAATAAGLSIREIAEIIDASSREGLKNSRLAA